MKYRRDTTKDKVMQFIGRGMMGLGALVVLLSVTQGIPGVIGVVLMMVLISAGYGGVMWLARFIEGLLSRRGGENV